MWRACLQETPFASSKGAFSDLLVLLSTELQILSFLYQSAGIASMRPDNLVKGMATPILWIKSFIDKSSLLLFNKSLTLVIPAKCRSL